MIGFDFLESLYHLYHTKVLDSVSSIGIVHGDTVLKRPPLLWIHNKHPLCDTMMFGWFDLGLIVMSG